MRYRVKLRVYFLVLAILSYVIGFNILPDTLISSSDIVTVTVVAGWYFIALPMMYWLWIIKAGGQKPWKLLMILSLSGLMARLSFPEDIARYFEFIMWLRYPIIAVLLIVELYLVVSIVKGLWYARSLKGDPRLHCVEQYKDEDDKKRSLALGVASEPASWYYAIPWFSRQHAASIAQLRLWSASPLHWWLMLTGTLSLSAVSYVLISQWSELVAFIVSSVVAYGIVFITANHRVSRYFSVYIQQEKLVINNSLWGFLVINLFEVKAVERVELPSRIDKAEMLKFGRGDSNIRLRFTRPQTYFGALGQLPETIEEIDLAVFDPESLVCFLQENLSIIDDESLLNVNAKSDTIEAIAKVS